MYEGGKGGVCAGGGVCLLPNTGGSILLTVVAWTGIVVGVAIILTTLYRFVAKRAYKA